MKIPVLDYTYYRIYSAFKQGRNSDPAYSAFSVMILVVGGLMSYLLEQFDLNKYLSNKVSYIIAFSPLLVLLYFLILFKARYKSIEKRYIGENKRQRIVGYGYLVILTFITVGAYFGLFIIE